MTHYLMIVLVAIVISITDGRSIMKKKLYKELYAYAAFTIVILIYGFLYFSNSFNASISDLFNKVLVHK